MKSSDQQAVPMGIHSELTETGTREREPRPTRDTEWHRERERNSRERTSTAASGECMPQPASGDKRREGVWPTIPLTVHRSLTWLDDFLPPCYRVERLLRGGDVQLVREASAVLVPLDLFAGGALVVEELDEWRANLLRVEHGGDRVANHPGLGPQRSVNEAAERRLDGVPADK